MSSDSGSRRRSALPDGRGRHEACALCHSRRSKGIQEQDAEPRAREERFSIWASERQQRSTKNRNQQQKNISRGDSYLHNVDLFVLRVSVDLFNVFVRQFLDLFLKIVTFVFRDFPRSFDFLDFINTAAATAANAHSRFFSHVTYRLHQLLAAFSRKLR